MKKRFKQVIFGIAIATACIALGKMCNQVVSVLRTVTWTWVVFAVTGLTLYQLLNASIWRDVIAGIGAEVPRGHAMRVWIESESMKWLPGGIWGYGSRVVNARKLGIRPELASASLAIELLLTIVAWCTAALWILPTDRGKYLIDYLSDRFLQIRVFPWSLAGGALLVLILLRAVKMDFTKLTWARRFLGSFNSLDWKPQWLLRSAVSYWGLCLLNGTLLWLVTWAIPGLTVPWPAIIGAGGIAWLAGFFAIGVPGGIGVREAALVGMLHPYGPVEAAVAAAMVFRAAQMVAELLALGGSLFYGWRKNQNALAISDASVIS